MILIMFGVLTFAVCAVLYWRCAVEQRAIRWELYALRDELRKIAYEQPTLRNTDMFNVLDRRLTFHCANHHNMSFWAVIPAMIFDRERIERRQRDFETRLHQPQNKVFVPIYAKATTLLGQNLLWRHLFFVLASAVTLVGVVAVYSCAKWLMARVVSEALAPMVPATEVEPIHV